MDYPRSNANPLWNVQRARVEDVEQNGNAAHGDRRGFATPPAQDIRVGIALLDPLDLAVQDNISPVAPDKCEHLRIRIVELEDEIRILEQQL